MNSIIITWMYGISGNDYRVVTLLKTYLIVIEKFEIDRKFKLLDGRIDPNYREASLLKVKRKYKNDNISFAYKCVSVY